MKDINDMTPEERTQAWDDALANFKMAIDTIQRLRQLLDESVWSTALSYDLGAEKIEEISQKLKERYGLDSEQK